MSDRPTIHMWGFFDGNTPRPSDRVAVCEGSVYDAYCTVVANVTHFGSGVTNKSTTRDMDGWLRGVEFETPERENGKAARMWHRIFEATDPWPWPTESATTTPADVRADDEGVTA